MGWKGTLRSVNSAIKAAERGSKRKQRELERQRKEYNKMVELEQAQKELDSYKPGFFDNLFNRTEKKRVTLSLAVEKARKEDEKYYEQLW